MTRRLSVCLINPRSQPSYRTFDFGMPFMSRYVITLDLAAGRLWLAKAG